mmetsp:Transcript_23238/g.72369  ORF Transcript_23238/g.72369 Transcript_23238/m.72369 type:complete len:200 (-) Transcript_23238:291-890(-)
MQRGEAPARGPRSARRARVRRPDGQLRIRRRRDARLSLRGGAGAAERRGDAALPGAQCEAWSGAAAGGPAGAGILLRALPGRRAERGERDKAGTARRAGVGGAGVQRPHGDVQVRGRSEARLPLGVGAGAAVGCRGRGGGRRASCPSRGSGGGGVGEALGRARGLPGIVLSVPGRCAEWPQRGEALEAGPMRKGGAHIR